MEENPIKNARVEAGLTQVQLAEKAGCSQQEIQRWESGRISPTAKTLKKLAEAIGCNPGDLI
jgi:transcriptional regulator with XRE-family HTH domain